MPRIILKRRPSSRNDSPGTLLGAREHRSHHHARRAGGERLDDVARILDAAVGDDRNVARPFDRVEHRGELRNSDAGDDARRADRARPDADFHRVDAALDERRRAFARRDVAGDELDVREMPRARRPSPRSTPSLWPCAVSMTSTSTPASISALRAIRIVAGRADRRRDPQPPVLVLVRVRVLAALVNVLDRDQSLQLPVRVHDRQLLDAMLAEDPLRFVERRAHGRGDQTVDVIASRSGRSRFRSNCRSRLVMIPTRRHRRRRSERPRS